jgi:aminoglycoside phosphotransferase family enzyme/predicted kinase
MGGSLRGLARNPMRMNQDAILEHLVAPHAYPHATEDIRCIETHISWVFLTGPFAYKIKKAVKLPYLDFSTLDRRKQACRDELALNSRLAPDLYHEVVAIGGDAAAIRIGGTPALEYAVKMTQFPDGAIADELIEKDALSAAELSRFAEDIAAFHLDLPPDRAESPGDRILDNLTELESDVSDNDRPALEEIRNWIRSTIAQLATTFADRDASGRIRECHGDLHLSNVVRIDDRLIAFDCLEFSKSLRTIDLLDEVAFLFMDLVAYRRSDLAFVFLNAWLTVTGDYPGLRLLRLYAVHRALVRAKVEIAGARTSDQGESVRAGRYLKTALSITCPPRPYCLITMGLSGSGKSTIAAQLIGALGAVVLRSDIERKRLHGYGPAEDSGSGVGSGIYRPESTEKTYRHLLSMADAVLESGISVVIDGSFLKRRFRDSFHDGATKRNASFAILHCNAPTATLRQRIIERSRQRQDASEANLAVLENQLKTADAIDDAESAFVISLGTDSSIDTDELVSTIRSRSDQVSLSSTST